LRDAFLDYSGDKAEVFSTINKIMSDIQKKKESMLEEVQEGSKSLSPSPNKRQNFIQDLESEH
jgi:hypothetical protein